MARTRISPDGAREGDGIPDAEVAEGPRAFDTPLPPEPPSPPPPPAPRRSGGAGIGAMFLGGVLAAGAGFFGARYVPDGWPFATVAPVETRIAAQEAEVKRLAEALAARPETDLSPLADGLGNLRDQVAALEAAIAAVPAPPADPAARLDAIETRLTALEARPEVSEALNSVEARLSAVEAVPAGALGGDPAAAAKLAQDLAAFRAELAAAKAGAPGDLAALRVEVAALREELAAGGAAADGARGEIAAAVEAARQALAEAEARAADLRAATDAAVAAARRDAALGRIAAALDNGAPFAGAAADLAAAGTEIPAAMAAVAETGVPTLLSLQTAFPEAARAALAASLRADMGETTMERFGSFLRTQAGVRSLEPREGSDPDAVLSRAAAALAGGDLPAALAEIGALPEAGQAEMAGWATLARQRADATAAFAALAAAP